MRKRMVTVSLTLAVLVAAGSPAAAQQTNATVGGITTPSAVGASGAEDVSVAASGTRGVSTASGVRLRTAPVTGTVIGHLTRGEAVYVTCYRRLVVNGYYQYWYRVKRGWNPGPPTAWVALEYIYRLPSPGDYLSRC